MVDAFNPDESAVDAAVAAFREAMPPGAEWVLAIRRTADGGHHWQDQTSASADMLIEAAVRLSAMAYCTATAAGMPREEADKITAHMMRQMAEFGTVTAMYEVAKRAAKG
jgi:hypothetical protein